MSDPGVSLKATTVEAALRLLEPALGTHFEPHGELPEEAIEAVEALSVPAGLRSRRVLLDADWWNKAGAPMLARVAERRRVPRGPAPSSPSAAAGTGWVVLVPQPHRGYRMRAAQPEDFSIVEWPVDQEIAARLAPFAFTFHRRFARRVLGARDLVRFARASGGRDLGLLIAAGLAAALVGLLTPVATGWLIDRAIPAGDANAVIAVMAGLAVAGVTLLALDLLRSLAVQRFEARIGVSMQAAIVDRVISAPARFFRAFASGDLALRMAAVNTVQRSLTASTIGGFVTAAFLLANLALMITYSPALTLAASSVVALVIAVSTLLGVARLKLGARIEALEGQLGSMTFEMFAGIAKLRASAAEPRAFHQWYAKYDLFRTVGRASAQLHNWEAVALSLLQPAAMILVLWLSWELASSAALTTGDYVAFQAAMFGLLGGVHGLVSTALELLNLKPVYDRARPILETLPEDAGGGGQRHDPLGAVALEGVTFAYPGGAQVLNGIDLTIRPGEFVAIVGASGSGKSTLIRLLLGFEAPAAGTVRYDGVDLAKIDLRYLRRRMGTVLQGGRLWAGDLYTNIAGAAALSVEAAWEAARLAGLASDIEAMPMGLYTMVGEGLSTLSGGQRQRVLIARALVGAPRILLLDEATSALDNVSQAAVLEGLARLKATRIVIAHRLNTVRQADRIVVLEGGRIVQQGSYRELQAERGPFAAMLARQVA